MVRKKKQINNGNINYSKTKSFENLETVQQMALNRKGKDDEVNPDISIFLKAEELKCKLCGLYEDKENVSTNINVMGSVKINGQNFEPKIGESTFKEKDDGNEIC